MQRKFPGNRGVRPAFRHAELVEASLPFALPFDRLTLRQAQGDIHFHVEQINITAF